MDAMTITDEFELDGDLTKQPGVKVIHVGGEPRRTKKKPVSLSFDDAQIGRVDARAAQSGANRSGQIQRDLMAYWALLAEGFRRIQKALNLEDMKFLAQIFKGRVLVASDDVLWCDALLGSYIRNSKSYADARMADTVADKIDHCDHFARLSLMDWLRRAAVCADNTLFDGFVHDEPMAF